MLRHLLVIETPDDALADLRTALAGVTESGARLHLDVVRDGAAAERRLAELPSVDVCVVPYPEGDGRTCGRRHHARDSCDRCDGAGGGGSRTR